MVAPRSAAAALLFAVVMFVGGQSQAEDRKFLGIDVIALDATYLVTKGANVRIGPKTEFKITAAGRRELERYLEHMDALIQATRRR